MRAAVRLALALAVWALGAPAHAQCGLDVSPLAFGRIAGDAAVEASAVIGVRCDGVPGQTFNYRIALVSPPGGGASSAMPLRYRITLDPQHRRPWGDGQGDGEPIVGQLIVTGTSAYRVHAVYARIEADAVARLPLAELRDQLLLVLEY